MVSNLEYYRVFYMVAKTGRFTEAAQKLNISQPAVSQAVRQLESQLGVSLFVRAARGVHLTKEGELLYKYVSSGYEQFLTGEEQILRMKNLDYGEVRIGASDMTLKYFLLPYLEKFHEMYPDIKVVVTNGPTPETIRYLQSGKIDFGIISTPFVAEDYIESVQVKEIDDAFVCGRRFIPYKNKTLDFHELSQMPIISLEKTTSSRRYMDDFLLTNGVTLQPEFELATSDMIVQFALRSLGVGIVMRDFAQEYLDSGRLFELRFNKIIPKRHFCLVTDTRNTLSVASQHLKELILSPKEMKNER